MARRRQIPSGLQHRAPLVGPKSLITSLLCATSVLSSAQGAIAQDAVAQNVTGQTQMPELFSVGYLAQVLGSLFVVFLCLFAVILLLRRFNRLGAVSGAPLKVVGSASVGHRERIVLIEAGDEQMLLGVAPGNVRMLHVLPEPITASTNSPAPQDFASILRAANPLGGRS
ncbi:MAG: flagellar biosynthetic protein FliO [Pseudomonadota bacterium]